MVFVHVHRNRPGIEPTREEMALLQELQARGVDPDGVEGALVAHGIEPDRARALADLVRPRSAAQVAASIATAVFWVAVAMTVAMGEGPLRRWLREHHPGTEWLVGLLFPLVVLVAFLWTLLSRLRRAREEPETVTRADKIDNKPIG